MTPAKQFLIDNLPGEYHVLLRKAKLVKIAPRSLHRAAKQIGVHRELRGFGDKKSSYWSIDSARKDLIVKQQHRDLRMAQAAVADMMEMKTNARTDLEHDLYAALEKRARTFLNQRVK